MLATVLFWIGCVLLGAAVIVGAVFAAAWFVAREINAGHQPDCSCPTCQGKRSRAWKARHGQDGRVIPRINRTLPAGQWNKDRKPPPPRSVWISTLELREGMRVFGKQSGSIYEVRRVTRTTYGFMVVLVNQLTLKESVIPVQAGKAQNRIWLIRRPKGSEG